MLQIKHRESHDIDLFIDDAQYLPYLNPETQGYDLALAPSDYETDGTRALKIMFDGVGEIDFICCNPVTEEPFVDSEIRGRSVKLEQSYAREFEGITKTYALTPASLARACPWQTERQSRVWTCFRAQSRNWHCRQSSARHCQPGGSSGVSPHQQKLDIVYVQAVDRAADR